jgi:hypothetical protein
VGLGLLGRGTGRWGDAVAWCWEPGLRGVRWAWQEFHYDIEFLYNGHPAKAFDVKGSCLQR